MADRNRHARGPSRLARLVKDLTRAAASQACVERIFSARGLLYSGQRRDERLHETQTVLEETYSLVHGNRLSETWC